MAIPNSNTRHPEYNLWAKMKNRCNNPRHEFYAFYGGRGITVCEQWRRSFQAFLDDVGPRPSKNHSLDRYPNPNGNYEPNNVRWATRLEQSHNRRDNLHATLNDKTQLVIEWVRELGLNYSNVRSRIVRGMSPEEALTAPFKTRRRSG